MKKLVIVLMSVISMLSFSQDRSLGAQCFMNGDGSINVAVNAFLAYRFVDKEYLPFVIYFNTDKGVEAKVNRADIVLEVNGKTATMPEYGEFRKSYKRVTYDRKILDAKPNLCRSAGEFNSLTAGWEKRRNFFPTAESVTDLSDSLDATYRVGAMSMLYFENPGLKRGDRVTIKVLSKSGAEGSVSFTL